MEQLALQLFEVGQPHRLGDKDHPTEVPSGRCLAHHGEFSKAKTGGEWSIRCGRLRMASRNAHHADTSDSTLID